MNGHQRIKAALTGVMPDRRPVMLHSFMVATRYAGHTMKEYRDDPRIAAQCHIQFVEEFGVDGVFFDVDTALMADAIGCPVDFPTNEPARVCGQRLSSLDDVELLEEKDISNHPRIQHSIETMRLLREYFGHEVFLRGNCDQAPFSLACAMRGPETFMLDLIMESEKAMKLIEYTTRRCTQMIRLMADAGVDMVSNGDSPAGPQMISPEMYRRFACQSERAMLCEAHRHGLPYLLHICGKTDRILSAMTEIGLDAVELDYKTSIEAIHHNFAASTTLFGTVDPSGVIALGSPEDIRREILTIAERYRDNPRLVLGAGCAIPPMAPRENIFAFVKTVHELQN